MQDPPAHLHRRMSRSAPLLFLLPSLPQRHITIHHETIPGANHFFVNEMPQLMKAVDNYLDFRLDPSCTIR